MNSLILRRSLIWFSTGVFLAAAAPCSFADTPTNDAYSDSILLAGGGGPMVVASNAGASLEEGEFNPRGIGGASVWYRWVAPSTAWHEVTTESDDPAHDLDTVLVLYRAGADLAGATRLGFNHESWSTEGQSRLVFLAEAGQEYRIAVHGFEGQTGTFRLAVAAAPPPGVRAVAATFNPPSVDVGASSATSTASVQIQTDAAFEGISLYLRAPQTGRQVGFAYVEPSMRVSGTEFDGIYEAEFSVQAYRPPGVYPLTAFAWDDSGGYSWSPEGGDEVEDFFLMPGPASLEVRNSASVDEAPPVLLGLSGMPAVVDLTDGNVVVPLSVNVSDPLAGFVSGEVVVRSADDDWEIGDFDANDRIGGTAQDGSYAFTVRFRDNLPLGTFNLEYDLRDALGNRVRYGHPDGPPVPAGIPSTVEITATIPGNDAFANAITLAAYGPPPVQGTTRFASREAGEPDLGDGAGGSVWYRWTPGTTGWFELRISSENQDQVVGLFNGTSFESLSERGRSDGSIRSDSGERSPMVFFVQNGITYHLVVCASSSYSTGEPFELELESVLPGPPLWVSDAFFQPGVIDIATGSREVVVRLDVATDTPFLTGSPGSGWLQVTLKPDSAFYDGPPLNTYLSGSNRIAGDESFGTFEATFTLPPFIPPGPWDLVVEAGLDSTDRQVWTLVGSNPVPDANIIPGALGGNPRLQVENTGLIDIEAPVLSAFSGLPASLNLSGGAVDTVLELAITDVGGGFREGSMFLISTGAGPIYNLGPVTEATRISGDARDGIYRIPYTFAETIPPGQYRLSIGLNDLAGNSRSYGGDIFDNSFPGGANSVIEISNTHTGYPGWAASQDFGPLNLNAPMDDPNGDGVPNLLCYAFNLPPNGPPSRPMRPGMGDLAGLPAISLVGEGENRRLRIEFLRRQDAGNNLTYATQFGDHLDSSEPGGLQDAQGTFSFEFISPEWIRIIIEDPVLGADRRFGRVRVDLND